MGDFIYQVQDARGGNWREVSKNEVKTVVRREMGESLLEEVLKEMHVHGMEFLVNDTWPLYRAVRKDGSVIGYEGGCCGKVAA